SMPQSERVKAIANFVHDAKIGLARTGTALQATAHPIELEQVKASGRSWVLSAQVQSYGIALTMTFLALLLAAGATAAERDEGTIGRLRRGLVPTGRLLAAKVALAAVVGVVLGAAIAVVFGIVVEIGGVTGGEPWARLPLLVVGVALAAAAVGAAGAALGGLAREARAASLLAGVGGAAGRVPRLRARGGVWGGVGGERVPALRARRALVLGGALRREPMGDARRRDAVAAGDRGGALGAGEAGNQTSRVNRGQAPYGAWPRF